MTYKTILTISDIHAPFQHPKCFEFLKALKTDFKPDLVVCQGDEIDFHAISKYATDPDGMSPGYELEAGVEFLRDLYDLFPNVAVCTSNHTVRPLKRAYEAGIPKRLMKTYREFLEAPEGWVWKDHWIFDNTFFFHGEGHTGRHATLRATEGKRMNTVIGHVHSNAGVHYLNNGNSQIWGMNTGCLINPDAYAFHYGKAHRDKPCVGTGLIIAGVPNFIPMSWY